VIRSFKRKAKIGRWKMLRPQPKNCARRWSCGTTLIRLRTLFDKLTQAKIVSNDNRIHLGKPKLLYSGPGKNRASTAKSKW